MSSVVTQVLHNLQQCDDEKEILRLLGLLKSVPMTLDLLGSTQVAVRLKEAKKRMPLPCADAAQGLINSWKKQFLKDPTLTVSRPPVVRAPEFPNTQDRTQPMTPTPATHLDKVGVPSLFDICCRLLETNLDQVPVAGFAHVPDTVFQRIVERAKPSPGLLVRIEATNPSLAKCCDSVWRLHCLRMYPQITEQDKPPGVTWRQLIHDFERQNAAKMATFSKRAKDEREAIAAEKALHATKLIQTPLASQMLTKKRTKALVDRSGVVKFVPTNSSSSAEKSAASRVLAKRKDLFAQSKRAAQAEKTRRV